MVAAGGRLRVAVLFGGRSGEHEVSLMSARSVLSVLDPNRYDVFQIGITPEGSWLSGPDVLEKLEAGARAGLEPVAVFGDPSKPGVYSLAGGTHRKLTDIDVYFPLLHGTFGEDGTLQGLFELADVAYVGACVVGSAVGMDKGIFKELARAQGIPVLDWIVLHRSQIAAHLDKAVELSQSVAPFPLFTKPANLGSSVGITKCRSRADLEEGLLEAARYDRRVLVERGAADAREIEVSVLGNDEPKASVPGEILPSREFYSYESKYVDGSSQLIIPAEVPPQTIREIQEYAIRAFRAIDCAGMARVDFFLERGTGSLYLNELNTIPGFTKISMYPKLWEASGLSYDALVDALIQLALERKAERDRTEHAFRRTG